MCLQVMGVGKLGGHLILGGQMTAQIWTVYTFKTRKYIFFLEINISIIFDFVHNVGFSHSVTMPFPNMRLFILSLLL